MNKMGCSNLKKLLSVMLITAFVVGITISHIDKVSANSSDNSIGEINVSAYELGDNFSYSELSTNTMNMYYSVLENMTQEEFEEIFTSQEYEEEFASTYETVTRGEGKLSQLGKKLKNASSEYIDKVSEAIFKKLPTFIKSKYNVSKTVVKVVVKKLIEHLDNSQLTTAVLSAIIVKFTGIPIHYVKPVLDIVVHVIDRIINKDNQDASETPCVVVFPTATPSAEPSTQEPTTSAEPSASVEPVTSEPAVTTEPSAAQSSTQEPAVSVEPN
ncbi:MAG: hypothetical protein E7262_01520 [Lachnospiraceae bacterium]|nr:hypothetical protein [Lachnospiraceae bacterium]